MPLETTVWPRSDAVYIDKNIVSFSVTKLVDLSCIP